MLANKHLLLSTLVALVALSNAAPTAFAGPVPIPVPQPTAAPLLDAREAAPSFTGVSIPDVPEPSIPSISIPEPSIPPISIKSASTKTTTSLNLNLPSKTSLHLDLPTPTCTQTIKPDKNGYVPPGTCGSLYNYYPSFSAAIAFGVLFGLLMIAHLVQAFLHKKKFAWVICMAAIWEFGSYASRVAGTRDQQSEIIATVSQLLVLLAPLWVNAFDYMVFARMVHFFSPQKKIWKISPSILAFIFVTLDIFSFIIQLIGGGMAGPGADPETAIRGVHIYQGGIGLQEFFIVLFLGLIALFHKDMIKAERLSSLSRQQASWRPLLYGLYVSLLAITVRIVFRLIEFGKGFDPTKNPLIRKEAFFYALEAFPMFIAILAWNIVHPGRYMQGPGSELPRSWLSRKLCCCFHRKDKKGTHQIIGVSGDDEELKGLRSRDPSQDRGRARSASTGDAFDYSYNRSNEPSPNRSGIAASKVYEPYAHPREPSPYRQQEYLEPPRYA